MLLFAKQQRSWIRLRRGLESEAREWRYLIQSRNLTGESLRQRRCLLSASEAVDHARPLESSFGYQRQRPRSCSPVSIVRDSLSLASSWPTFDANFTISRTMLYSSFSPANHFTGHLLTASDSRFFSQRPSGEACCKARVLSFGYISSYSDDRMAPKVQSIATTLKKFHTTFFRKDMPTGLGGYFEFLADQASAAPAMRDAPECAIVGATHSQMIKLSELRDTQQVMHTWGSGLQPWEGLGLWQAWDSILNIWTGCQVDWIFRYDKMQMLRSFQTAHTITRWLSPGVPVYFNFLLSLGCHFTHRVLMKVYFSSLQMPFSIINNHFFWIVWPIDATCGCTYGYWHNWKKIDKLLSFSIVVV